MGIEHIVDPDDPRLGDYRDLLLHPEPRRERGMFVAEGREIVGRLLEAGRFSTRSVLVTAAGLEALGERFAAHPALPVYVAPSSILRAVVGYKFHLGCLAVAERPPAFAPAALIDPPGPRLVVALEHLTDPDNVGSVFRNALAFGAHALLLSARCADPLYRKAIRTSVGASLIVPFARLDAWADGLARLRDAGYTLVALTPEATAVGENADHGPGAPIRGGARRLDESADHGPGAPIRGGARRLDESADHRSGVPIRSGERRLDIAAFSTERPRLERVALFVGAEGAGLSAETRASADVLVSIPMAPGVDSLNVATAAGIALHRLGRAAP